MSDEIKDGMRDTPEAQVKDLGNSEIEISAEIPAEKFESYRKGVLKKLGESAEVPGFRKGHIPDNVLVQKFGENTILYDMASTAIEDFYPAFVLDNTIEALGRPEITITKIAKGNPLAFKAKTAVMPTFELPDYKALAVREMKHEEVVAAEDAEVENTILEIRKNWAAAMKRKDADTESAGEGSAPILDASGKPITSAPRDEMPELNDDFVKNLGDFKDVADFRMKLKENIRAEKEAKLKEKKRMAAVNAIAEKTKLALPRVLVEGELSRMVSQFKHNLSLMGHTFEGYLAQIKKTEDEVRAGWTKDAEARAKTQIILDKIARAENITVPEDELKAEVRKIMDYYPEAPEERARAYAEGILRNEKVFEFLESLAGGEDVGRP
ncbi:MAG: trigger factor [Patescibacteria group bacterium]